MRLVFWAGFWVFLADQASKYLVVHWMNLREVADFLNMSCCGFTNPFSFNIADIAIFAGAFGMVIFGGESKKDA